MSELPLHAWVQTRSGGPKCPWCGQRTHHCHVSAETRRALIAFAKTNGRNWRGKLKVFWDVQAGEPADPRLRYAAPIAWVSELAAAAFTIGPKGLAKVNIPAAVWNEP